MVCYYLQHVIMVVIRQVYKDPTDRATVVIEKTENKKQKRETFENFRETKNFLLKFVFVIIRVR